MPPDNNQTAQRSVHGNQIPSIGRVETPYPLAGTPDTGYALRGATRVATVKVGAKKTFKLVLNAVLSNSPIMGV
jgi:hypothetical protein